MLMDNTEYKKVFDFIKSEVLKHDPVGLIDGGAPEDEYDTEIGKLIGELPKIEKDEQKYYEIIVKVFRDIGKLNEKNCKALADILYNGL
ncbi:hypothetical protein A2693_04280 [Candidatus Curtissbacteria bacterium RIFCSPHIGHO2_01_FULL_40_12]|uniref:Uncharacterized protein n=1 Tax=Candidatus Curtissbacteria bacterium RIFCSPHIGHO2_01_FULL_40_12 TaxID=1797710 RepID=A0A1F5G9E6_9BACT|nr:MAG: hypothetical protein A2693_04280 [Candidatus Curtissbacteria bacterium RIFCSPHIGHO2_01_FULL_40_12]